jgi:ribosomal-protein-serine acetyltransferase
LSKKVTIGYWLGKDFQKNGVMSRSVKYLINYAFDKLKMHRIDIAAATENMKSRKIPEKFGFTQEGVSRESEWLNDHYVDNVWYGLLENEWKK